MFLEECFFRVEKAVVDGLKAQCCTPSQPRVDCCPHLA